MHAAGLKPSHRECPTVTFPAETNRCGYIHVFVSLQVVGIRANSACPTRFGRAVQRVVRTLNRPEAGRATLGDREDRQRPVARRLEQAGAPRPRSGAPEARRAVGPVRPLEVQVQQRLDGAAALRRRARPVLVTP